MKGNSCHTNQNFFWFTNISVTCTSLYYKRGQVDGDYSKHRNAETGYRSHSFLEVEENSLEQEGVLIYQRFGPGNQTVRVSDLGRLLYCLRSSFPICKLEIIMPSYR